MRFLRASIFPGNVKGRAIIATAVQRLTQDEMHDYLGENFDIPDDGVNSDIEGLDAMKIVWKKKATSLPRKQPT